MKATSSLFLQLGIALALTFLAFINDFIFSQFLSGLVSAKLNLTFIIFLYLGYLIWVYHATTGRLSLCIVNLTVILICLFTGLGIITMIYVYLALIGVNRAILCYSSILAVIVDSGLCLFTASMVYWLLFNGYSLVIALWCLLLLQSLHSLIPGKKTPAKTQASATDNFDHALQSAESALQQLLK